MQPHQHDKNPSSVRCKSTISSLSFLARRLAALCSALTSLQQLNFASESAFYRFLNSKWAARLAPNNGSTYKVLI